MFWWPQGIYHLNIIITWDFFFSPQNMMTLVVFLNKNYYYLLFYLFLCHQGAKFCHTKKHWFERSRNFGCNFFSFGCLCTRHTTWYFIILRKLRELSSVHKMMCPPPPLSPFWGGDMNTLTLGSVSSLKNCQNSEMNFCENMKARCWNPS